MIMKQFKDPVHGYIAVPESLCKCFIDTTIFQRLRHVEQTSMRCLFPGAHHDRFAHSLGVFHLGRWAYDALLVNTKTDKDVNDILQDKKLRHTFLIACLMHDCGHAPFSHTLEKFYNDSGVRGGVHNAAYLALTDCFSEDFKVEEKEFKPAPHEAMSAVVLKECYGEKTSGLDWDVTLAARMITGCKHHSPTTLTSRVQNILIGLLNSSAIDMDKLDYIIRDTWASGIKNSTIDVHRLLEAVTIVNEGEGNIRLAYRKSALSVIQSVIDARNYLYEWIYNHHAVLYYAEMLKRSVLSLGSVLDAPQSNGECLKKLFSKDVFQKTVSLREGEHSLFARLLTDGDILFYLKIFCLETLSYNSYSSHISDHFAVWKTEAEYRSIFKAHQYQITENQCRRVLESLGITKDQLIFCDGKAKLHTLQESEILIDFGERQAPFTDVIPQRIQQATSKKVEFFYLYVSNSFKSKKDEIIKALVHEARSLA